MEKYDVFSLVKLIENGIGRKLERIEEAVTRLGPYFEPVTITESFVFIANTKTGDLYRLRYVLNEDTVGFSEPTKFEIDYKAIDTDANRKEIVGKIVEALAEGNDNEVEFLKAKLLRSEREAIRLRKKLNLNTGIRSQYLRNARKAVAEAIESVEGARRIFRGGENTKFQKLMEEGQVFIRENEKPQVVKESRNKLLYQKIVEVRKAAKHLHESPVFVEYASNLYEGVDEQEALEFITENYQELFTLSLSEQSKVFHAAIAKRIDSPDIKKVVNVLMKIGNAVSKNETLKESIEKIKDSIGADDTNFHARMQLVESEVGMQLYSRPDLKVISQVLGKIMTTPSDLFTPQFYNEVKMAKEQIDEMVSTGIIDEGNVTRIINLINQYSPSIFEGRGDGEEYRRFFLNKMKEWGIDSLDDLTPAEKEDFFKQVEDEWTKEDPKTDDRDKYGDEGRDNEGRIRVDEATGFDVEFLKEVVEG